MVKLWNDNKFSFEQEFKGEKIRIEAGGYVEMDYDDAVQFKSMYSPPQYDGGGNQLPESYKMIRVDGHAPHVLQESHVCTCCGDKFATAAELTSHVDKNHLDQMEDTKEADKRRKSASK